jgi:hypothetical protein
MTAMGVMARAWVPRSRAILNRTQIDGEDMFRLLGAGVLLLTIASTVTAGERYVEIWNPPEARIGSAGIAAGKCAPKAHSAASSRRNATKVLPRRVADPMPRSAPPKRTPIVTAKKPAAPPSLDIPRLITPEGNVLRV